MDFMISKGIKTGTVIKLFLLLLVFVGVFAAADDGVKTDAPVTQSGQTAQNSDSQPKTDAKQVIVAKPAAVPVKKEVKAPAKKKEKFVPIAKTVFVNCRVNPIFLTITDHKSRSFVVPIKMGQKYEYINKLLPEHLLKVICDEPKSPKTLVSKADLETYAVFVFNDNQMTDRYHFINFLDHTHAKKRARDLGLIELWDEINQQTMYNP